MPIFFLKTTQHQFINIPQKPNPTSSIMPATMRHIFAVRGLDRHFTKPTMIKTNGVSQYKNISINKRVIAPPSISISFLNGFLPQFFQNVDFFIPIEQIHCFKWNDFIVFVDDVDTRFFNRPDIKIMGIYKLHYDDSE